MSRAARAGVLRYSVPGKLEEGQGGQGDQRGVS